ncbi:unnamed protein product [Mytilus coruscus]|uniref:Uncharacterized protein n=1 Tax=Mytilus coruscus TaxID=42192 RepID=A0A6J8B9R9_MYTCO|nr:unnamed protein product [Mytilus coruscus]
MQLKRSVQNRIDEIRKLTAQDEWRYCQTKENPADLLTRGLTAERFLQNALWFNGHLLTDEKNGRHGSQRSQIVPTSKRLSLVKHLRLFLDKWNYSLSWENSHNEPLTESARFPYLLPNDHPLTRLVVLDVHETLKTFWVLATVTQMRQNILDSMHSPDVKKVLHICITSRKVGNLHRAPDPPPLPKSD